MTLKHFSFKSLQTVTGLEQCDALFLQWVKDQSLTVYHDLTAMRKSGVYKSETVLAVAPLFELFVSDLFGISRSVDEVKNAILKDDCIWQFKKEIVAKKAKKAMKNPPDLDFSSLQHSIGKHFSFSKCDDHERFFSQWALSTEGEIRELVVQWCTRAMIDEEGQQFVREWQSFRFPKKIDWNALFAVCRSNDAIQAKSFREREGFSLTDERADSRWVQNEVNYCVYCHRNDDDFCRKGFPIKKKQPSLGLKISPTKNVLTGCPLDEKISEMHLLRKSGGVVSALAVIMIDNPLCPATGHRICNDCMNACIYQKQDPVNIPQIETRILMDVLTLPYGVELYQLMVLWNPLRPDQFLPLHDSGKKIAVMGMGPAGFTLSHHLLMEGATVVGMDGLAIEPLPRQWVDGPIESYDHFQQDLAERPIRGFGGVAEYGITARWDKNFLSLIYLTLVRRPRFQIWGNVRFGGTVVIDDFARMGFDHLSLALGAGLPKELNVPGSLAPGMRQANDFLMALQLTGAIHPNSRARMQIRMPAVVIGGGLTGVDASTEIQAYYQIFIERIWRLTEILKSHYEKDWLSSFSPQEQTCLIEWRSHAQQWREHRSKKGSWRALITKWGGVSIVYRKTIQDSPAYRTNPHELEEALREGLFYRECMEPQRILLDEFGHVCALKVAQTHHTDSGWEHTGKTQEIPARTVLVATGARPNIAYHFEHYGTFVKNQGYYQPHRWNDDHLEIMTDKLHCKEEGVGFFTNALSGDMHVTALGDLHPTFHGSVVKAMASGKEAYRSILDHTQASHQNTDEFLSHLSQQHQSVIENIAFHEGVVEMTVRSPIHAIHYKPGNFYRISQMNPTQTHDAFGFWPSRVSIEKGLLTGFFPINDETMDVLSWEKGQYLHFMGPTGVRYRIEELPSSSLILVDERNIYRVLSICSTLKDSGHQVWLGLFVEKRIPDCIMDYLSGIGVWFKTVLCQHQNGYTESLTDFLNNDLSPALDPSEQINSVLVSGVWPMVQSTQALKRIAPHLFSEKLSVKAAVHGPMQCMLKGICAQCLQWQVNPETGQRTKAVFACSWQDQPIDIIDWQGYRERNQQNAVVNRLHQLIGEQNLKKDSDVH